MSFAERKSKGPRPVDRSIRNGADVAGKLLMGVAGHENDFGLPGFVLSAVVIRGDASRFVVTVAQQPPQTQAEGHPEEGVILPRCVAITQELGRKKGSGLPGPAYRIGLASRIEPEVALELIGGLKPCDDDSLFALDCLRAMVDSQSS